jgi:hypothetical protein
MVNRLSLPKKQSTNIISELFEKGTEMGEEDTEQKIYYHRDTEGFGKSRMPKISELVFCGGLP